MKLLHYTSRIYLIYSLAIFAVSSVLIFIVINRSINAELHERLELTRDMLIRQLKSGKRPVSMPPYWEISKVDRSYSNVATEKDTVISLRVEEEVEEEVFRQKIYIRQVDNSTYKLVIRTPKTGAGYLFLSIAMYLLLIVIILLSFLIVINRHISHRLWNPFYQYLNALASYSFSDDVPIELNKSKIYEFEQLRQELLHLTNKLQKDYKHLKRFTENASHEIQTPLSIIITRLEQIMNLEELPPVMAKEIGAIFSAANRLSKLNQTLLLLSKIENRQFPNLEQVDLVSVYKRQIDLLRDLADVKSLRLTETLKSEVIVMTNLDLVEIFIANLLNNAIRHNYQGGDIHIRLNDKEFCVGNTGAPSDENPEEWFRRFKKGNPASSSAGLGLALVKEIGEIYGWRIIYTIEDGYHQLCTELNSK